MKNGIILWQEQRGVFKSAGCPEYYCLFELDVTAAREGGMQAMEEYYVLCEGEKLHFALPEDWKVLAAREIPPVPGVADPIAEIRRAMDNPIGSLP